ncbi:hypothetical protein KBB96_02975 [Luteolibacter ambystomatis]|uniref:PKD domain-containing protein n=1 Tax=Luteolibacter ambystomatis TaxID=2824561 RepID=A0A975J0N8_9BACT|nr:PKD domain-containing protein [Luteolibacter ambystomatis]QUE51861.1 hypothetical protein KBB96_02975 [Luteolibacter ambystomatis]
MKQTRGIVVIGVLSALAVGWLLWKKLPPASNDRVTAAAAGTNGAATPTPDESSRSQTAAKALANMAEADARLKNGIANRLIKGDHSPEALGAMKEAAGPRRVLMQQLIRLNPEAALQHALSFSEYATLPQEIQALVERPFTAPAKVEVYPVCGDSGTLPPGTPDAIRSLTFEDGSRASLWVYGQRVEMMSKDHAPLTGIILDGDAAVYDHALIPVNAADLAALGMSAPRSSVVTGALTNGTTTAIAGGKVFSFSDLAELEETNRRLSALDHKPDPHISSAILLETSFQPSAGQDPGLSLYQSIANAQANSTWTETVKRIFMIRVDTSDVPGAPFTQAQVADPFSGSVKSAVEEFSYGKTSLTIGVSANVYRLPQTTATYKATNNNGGLLLDARNTFRSTKSGADSAINIGPAGDAGGFGDYDIVGVVFAEYNLSSGGVHYAGLAGGTNMWLQNSVSSSVITHELGHNYGLGHSNRWDTTDGSIAGPGSSTEYGDIYDVMGGGSVPVDHFGAGQKSKLNWLTTADWTNATTSQNVRLYGIDRATSILNPRGVRMTKVATPGSEQYYWLTYRPRRTNNPSMTHGLHLAWVHGTHDLLDTKPATSTDVSDAALTVGRTYSDTTANIHVTPLATGGTVPNEYIDLRVNIGPFPGNAAPTASSITGNATVAARTANAYSVSASDSNGDTLAYAWDTKDNVYRNSNSSQTLNWTIGGTYTVDCTVSDMKGGTAVVSKTVTVTDPLLTWTSSAFPGTTNPVVGIAWGEHRFVAFGYFGTPYFSWDGVTWNTGAGSTNVTDGACHPAYGAGVFVAAGDGSGAGVDAGFSWSEDGRAWQASAFPATASRIEEVAYGTPGFLAVTGGGHAFLSTDGKTWTRHSVAGAPTFNHVAWEGSVWVASTSSDRKVLTSPDGITWTPRLDAGIDVDGLTGANGRSFITGWYGGIRYSDDDGVTWAPAGLPSATRWSTNTIRKAHDGTLVCTAQAMDESGAPSTILVSQDNGSTWARPTTNQAAGDDWDMAFGDGRFVVVQSGGIARYADPIDVPNHAPTGAAATLPSPATARSVMEFTASATDADADPLTYVWDFGVSYPLSEGASIFKSLPAGGTYPITLRVYDGRSGPVTVAQNLVVTDPLSNWTQRTITPGAGVSGYAGDLQTVAVGGGRIVAAGSLFSGAFKGPIAVSTDGGATWTGYQLGLNTDLYGMLHDGTRFVGCGQQYGFDGTAGWRSYIATSTDGIAWTQRFFANNGMEQKAVAWNGNAGSPVYVSCGNNGSLYRSTDSITWTAVATTSFLPSAAALGAVTYGNGYFLMTSTYNTGTAQRVFRSTDGLSWTDVSASSGVTDTNNAGTEAAFLNNRFLICGSGIYTTSSSLLRTSVDNGLTFTSNRTAKEVIEGFAYGSNLYFAAGRDQSVNGGAFETNLVSQDAINWYALTSPTSNRRRAAASSGGTFLTVGDALSIWQSDIVPVAGSYSQWVINYYPSGSSGNADPDQDGLQNFIEYGFNLNPNSNSPVSPNLPKAGATLSGRRGCAFTLPDPTPGDGVYRVMMSADLIQWTPIARKVGTANWQWLAPGTSRIETDSPSGGSRAVRCGVPDAQAGNSRMFLRVTVEVPQ